MAEGRCGRCGYRGQVWPGRFGDQRCWVCYAVQNGNPPSWPAPATDPDWAQRVRAALGIPEPEPDPEAGKWAYMKYGTPYRITDG